MKRLLWIGVLALTLVGCAREPDIPGYHWSENHLYDDNGQNVAGVISIPFGGGSQACVFHSPVHPDMERCTYWETKEQAYAYVVKAFDERGMR